MKIGDIVEGVITGIQPYGAFVQLDENNTGLIHISEISDGFVRDIHQYVKVGERVISKIIDIDDEHHQYRLSLKPFGNRTKRSRQNTFYKPIKPTIGFTTIQKMMPIWLEEAKEESKDD